MAREVFLVPQTMFIASCVAGVVSYVYFNIDSIREKQAIAVNKTMAQQASDLKSAQESQRDAIKKAQEEQQRKIREAQEKTKKR